MIERPLLLRGPQVRAFREGRQTQDRRPMKPQPKKSGPYSENYARWRHIWLWDIESWGDSENPPQSVIDRCPFGNPGDRLWIRETYLPDPPMDDTWDYYRYNDGSGQLNLRAIPERFKNPHHCIYREGWDGCELKWRPSIHMPRWASRLTLEIERVRVERIQDIAPDDAIAEGYPFPRDEAFPYPVDWFLSLWDSIYAKTYPWLSNPWVWVLDLKVIQ